MPTAGKFFIMVSMPDNNYYDYVFIGSSPLSLLHALTSTEEGVRILILNKENQLGGCWSWTSRDGLEYERAAHLIEALPGVYDLLQKASGVRFVDAPKQPERQFCGPLKFKMAYFSKFFLLGALAKISLELVASALLGRREQFFNSRVKLQHWFSVNLGLLVSRLPRVKVPETGYVSFIRGLVETCRDKGAEFQEARIDECRDDGNIWLVKASNGKQWQAKHLVLSSSVTMMETSEVGHLIAGNEDTRHRLSVILEIADEFRLRPFSYVSLFNHKLIRRVVDVTDKTQTPRGFGHYLFELSMTKGALDGSSEDEIDALAVSSCLFEKTASARLRFSSNFEYSIITSGLKSHDRLTVLDSFGNLAVGVKAWGRL
jgi:hypothetical protein